MPGSFYFHSSRRQWMKSKEALGLCISATSNWIPFATPENSRTILAFLFSRRRAAFYHCVQSEAQWGFQAKNLNFTFCLYRRGSSRLQVLQVTMATSRALVNELLTTVQPTSQEEEEEEPNHLVSATYYENNTDSRESLSPTVIPTLGSLCPI